MISCRYRRYFFTFVAISVRGKRLEDQYVSVCVLYELWGKLKEAPLVKGSAVAGTVAKGTFGLFSYEPTQTAYSGLNRYLVVATSRQKCIN